jgi:metal-responsive CopG/Arc/MetJ family transcriptional regulator
MTKKRTTRGRPPEHGEKALRKPVPIRLPDAMVTAIDAIAADRLDQPDRSTVIRELLVEALEARAAFKKKGRA